ncbi:MAG: NGG1p interacting factor NIF3 [Nitrospirae bacterium]|nr:NGG1p interacting factor NIF3 [Nitrospirota bacterium]
MNAEEIYRLAIEMGIKADPRSKKEVYRQLEKEKKQYEKLEKDDKEEFDPERLVNPYPDTRFLTGSLKKKVKRVLVGIDIDPAEVLLADRLMEKGKNIDLIISHHPEGKALASLDKAMHLQEDVMCKYGVPINVAEGLMSKRIAEVSRGIAPLNHNRVVDTARLLDYPFICVHTPADNLVYNFVDTFIERKNPETVGELVEILKSIPEYKEATKIKAGPRIFVGNKDGRAGKIAATEMTGGTSGAKEAYEKLSQAGVGTIVGMHMKETHKREAEKHHINVVIAGHIASDSLGMNIFLDELEKKRIEIIPCSGLIRISRVKNRIKG